MAEVSLHFPVFLLVIACASLYIRLVIYAQQCRGSQSLCRKKEREKRSAEQESSPALSTDVLSNPVNTEVDITTSTTKESVTGLRKRTAVSVTTQSAGTHTDEVQPSLMVAPIDNESHHSRQQHFPQYIGQWMQALLMLKVWDNFEARSGWTMENLFDISIYWIVLAACGPSAPLLALFLFAAWFLMAIIVYVGLLVFIRLPPILRVVLVILGLSLCFIYQ